jgi:hypothetical protein
MSDLSLLRHTAIGAVAGAAYVPMKALIDGGTLEPSYLIGAAMGGAIGGAVLGAFVFMVRRWIMDHKA